MVPSRSFKMNFKDLLQQLCSGLALSSSELQHIFDFWLSFLLNDSSTQFRTTAAMEMFTLGDIKDSVVQKKAYYENSFFLFLKNTNRKTWKKKCQPVSVLPNKILLRQGFNEEFRKLLKQYVSQTRMADPLKLANSIQ